MIKFKKVVAVSGLFLVFLVCTMIYTTRDLTLFPSHKTSIKQELKDNKWLHFEDRLKQVEKSLNKHQQEVGEIRQAMKGLVSTVSSPVRMQRKHFADNAVPIQSPLNRNFSSMIYSEGCPLQVDAAPQTNIQMLELYKSLTFDNPDGGVWKQGWKIEIDPLNWTKHHKLKVFVVPHSHNDPGWLRTFESYYLSLTKHILNNMIVKLQEDPRRKFIWAEISYLAMWWEELEPEDKDIVKRLIRNNQLEIVTGGWVMNDEANAHWLSIVHQLTEGHQWLERHLNYTPKSHWSIDPFGLSATQPFLLKQMGFHNALIQRVHYSVKKELAKFKNLEFRWKQPWDSGGKTELFTHMMPFYSYDIPHTCGPDPKICCQFDFKRMPGYGLSCPWRTLPEAINEINVPHKAEQLLDQYRKKSTLYKTNVLLVPLGDDFRYSHPTEWDVQYNNYQKLFDFMNSNSKMYVQIQFGTLTDYFNAVRAEKKTTNFPTLTGDFFTYADRDDHYWSGYYTSRPFYKRMDRVLLSYVRTAEIILTLAQLSGKPGSKWIANRDGSLHRNLLEARRALSLFQHHDGITGTAKDEVVVDYGRKMLNAIKATQNITQQCTNLLLSGPNADMPVSDTVHYNVDDIRQSYNAVAERHTITIGPQLSIKRLVIFNTLPFARQEIVGFLVSTPFIEILNHKGETIRCQVSPIFEYGATMSLSKYEVSFVADVPALGLISYSINALVETEVPPETAYATIKIFNQYADVLAPVGFKDVQVSPSASEFSIRNSRVTAAFSNLGLLKALKVARHTFPVHLDFAKYGARHSSERSGAYLFLPDGEATPVQISNTLVKVIEGPLFSSVTVQLPYVHHKVTLYNSTGGDGLGLEVENLVDIEKTSNFELAMRLSTNINSTNEFFTDINGYQIMRRIRFSKLPLQANYYPMPAMAYLEDKLTRLTVVTGSPLGCSSLREGQLEIMLDRRLNQDDSRGLGQGVTDNHPTRHVFRIILERKTRKCSDTADNHPSGFPSLSAHVALESLSNPLVRMLKTNDDDFEVHPTYVPSKGNFGVDFELSSLRNGVTVDGKEYIGVVLHRQHLDMCFSDAALLRRFAISPGSVNLNTLLPLADEYKINRSALSFMFVKEGLQPYKNITLCPMDVQAFLLRR